MFEAGTMLGDRYRLESIVAHGGMGTVWRASDLTLGREVAVKVLRPEYAASGAVRARLVFEATAAAAIESEHVVRIYDYGVHLAPGDAPAPYLVMELVVGQTLRDRLNLDGALAPDLVSSIVEDVAAGLAAVHARGLVHRDVKPGNILFTPDGRAKITDFGIAHGSDSADLTRTGTLVGTARYLAPEQVEGHSATPASDVYALGVVAYEALCGVAPFVAETDVATALARLQGPAPELPESVPESLRHRVRSLLQAKPENRPTAAALAAGLPLGSLVAATATRTLPPVSDLAPTRALRVRDPRRAAAAAVVAVAGVTIAVASIALAGAGDGDRPGTTTPSPGTQSSSDQGISAVAVVSPTPSASSQAPPQSPSSVAPPASVATAPKPPKEPSEKPGKGLGRDK